MPKIINFKNNTKNYQPARSKKYIPIKNTFIPSSPYSKNSIKSIYSEKYDINILIQYVPQKDKNKDKKYQNKKDVEDEKESEEESNLEEILKKFEEQLEESQNQEESNKIISLEEIIKRRKPKDYTSQKNNKKNSRNNIIDAYFQLRNYSRSCSNSLSPNIDPISGAAVYYVPPSQLSSGPGWRVLGMYVPSTRTIYIANNLSPQEERFVYYHEVAHALGERNEVRADAYAASKTGYSMAA